MTLVSEICRDDAVRTLGRLWLPASAVNAGVLTSLYLWYLADPGHPEAAASALRTGLLLGWLLVAPYLALGRVRRRCSRLELGLPLDAGRLWLRHAAAVVLGGTLILVTAAAVVWLLATSLHVGAGLATGLEAGRLAASLGLGLVLAVLILEGAQPTLHETSRSRGGYGLRLFAALAGVPALLLGLSVLPFFWTLPAAGATLALGVLTWRSVPRAYVLASARAEAQPRRGTWAEAADGRRGGLLLRLISGPPLWGSLASMLFFGVVFLSGLASALTGNDGLRLFFVPLIAAALMASVTPWLAQLPWYDPLPVSRRVLLAAIVAITLGSLAATYGIGKLATEWVERRETRIQLLGYGRHQDLRLPLEYLEIAGDGRPPEVTTPWGDSFTPPPSRPFAGSRAVLYSPYSLPEGSPPELVALQLARAVEAVFGYPISPEEIRERYLEVNGDGRVRFRDGRFALLDDHPGLEPRSEGPFFPVVLALVGVPWLILLALYFRACRPGWGQVYHHRLLLALTVAVAVLLGLGDFVGTETGTLDLMTLLGFLEIFLRQAGASAAGTLAVWGVCTALLAAGYRLAEAAFGRAELAVTLEVGS